MAKIKIETKPCMFCNKKHEVKVERSDYLKYLSGTLCQEAFPYLTPGEREMLISGTCPDCWNSMFNFECETDEYEDRCEFCDYCEMELNGNLICIRHNCAEIHSISPEMCDGFDWEED